MILATGIQPPEGWSTLSFLLCDHAGGFQKSSDPDSGDVGASQCGPDRCELQANINNMRRDSRCL